MKKLMVVAFLLNAFLVALLMNSCTYSVTNTMAHTQGTASDLIDDTQSQAPSTSIVPTVSIPAKAI